VDVLLAAGVDVNVRTASGTALHEAALCGKTEVVRTLLEAGVDLGIRDAARKTVSEVLRQFPAHVTHEISSLIQSEYTTSTCFRATSSTFTSRRRTSCILVFELSYFYCEPLRNNATCSELCNSCKGLLEILR